MECSVERTKTMRK